MRALIEGSIGLAGSVRALVFEQDISSGRLLKVLEEPAAPEWSLLASESRTTNLVTNVGRNQMTKLIVAETTLTANNVAVSTSTTVTPALTDTVATIPNRKSTQAVTIAQSFNSFFQRYIAYFSTVSFGSTTINLLALLDAATTVAGTNLWADSTASVSKTTTQALVVEWRINATTGA